MCQALDSVLLHFLHDGRDAVPRGIAKQAILALLPCAILALDVLVLQHVVERAVEELRWLRHDVADLGIAVDQDHVLGLGTRTEVLAHDVISLSPQRERGCWVVLTDSHEVQQMRGVDEFPMCVETEDGVHDSRQLGLCEYSRSECVAIPLQRRLHVLPIGRQHGVAVALRTDIVGVRGLVLLDAVLVGSCVGADGTQAVELAGHDTDVNYLHFSLLG